MEGWLAAARTLQFAAAILLTGSFAFECLVAAPGFSAAGADWRDATGPRRQLRALAWASLAVLVISGLGWLVAVATDISGEPVGRVWTEGTLGIVLTRTRFGQDWLLRGAGAVLVGAVLIADSRPDRRQAGSAAAWAGFAISALSLAGLAWAGHGAATAGAAGQLHLAGDIVHLLGAGAWLGTLPPLALLLSALRRSSHVTLHCWPPPGCAPEPAAVARFVIRRYSLLAAISVAALLAGGLVNTWFLAGTVPALLGTLYGRLLLGKIGLFVAMLLVAAVNLLRLSPRLRGPADPARRTMAQLRRGATIETALGIGVLAIVGLLGLLPPGLHTQAGWPLPFRIDLAALSAGARAAAAIASLLALLSAIGTIATAAAGRYRASAVLAASFAACLAAVWLSLGGAVEPAYPTSYYAPAEPYDAASIARGAAVFAANCAACHGADGRGDGPEVARLPVRPADLTEPHLFARSPGDLFWWVSHGRHDGAMPGFAGSLSAERRWDVINFIRARAAGELSRRSGPRVSAADAYPVPDFNFESDGVQHTLSHFLASGPVLLVLYGERPPLRRLHALVAARAKLVAAGLRMIAVGRGEGGPGPADPPPSAVTVTPEAKAALALFRGADDGGESELLLDRNGAVRARWTAQAAGLPGPDALAAAAARAARLSFSPPIHAGHVH